MTSSSSPSTGRNRGHPFLTPAAILAILATSISTVHAVAIPRASTTSATDLHGITIEAEFSLTQKSDVMANASSCKSALDMCMKEHNECLNVAAKTPDPTRADTYRSCKEYRMNICKDFVDILCDMSPQDPPKPSGGGLLQAAAWSKKTEEDMAAEDDFIIEREEMIGMETFRMVGVELDQEAKEMKIEMERDVERAVEIEISKTVDTKNHERNDNNMEVEDIYATKGVKDKKCKDKDGKDDKDDKGVEEEYMHVDQRVKLVKVLEIVETIEVEVMVDAANRPEVDGESGQCFTADCFHMQDDNKEGEKVNEGENFENKEKDLDNTEEIPEKPFKAPNVTEEGKAQLK